MFYLYDKKDGKQIKVTHKVDWMTAMRTGKYSDSPLGTPELVKESEPKGEVVDGISIEPEKTEKIDKSLGPKVKNSESLSRLKKTK